MIKVIVLAPQAEPYELNVASDSDAPKGTYESLKALIGGYLEGIHLGGGIDGFCHDEGKLIGFPPNVVCPTGALLVGTLVFTRTDNEGDTVSVKDGDLEYVKGWLKDCKRPGRFDYGF